MTKFNPEDDRDQSWLAASLTAYALGLKVESILTGDRGTPAEARARQIAMYLVHTCLGMSMARVARAFDRDRSTIGHACNIVEDLRDDPDFDTWIEQIEFGLSSVVGLHHRQAA